MLAGAEKHLQMRMQLQATAGLRELGHSSTETCAFVLHAGTFLR